MIARLARNSVLILTLLAITGGQWAMLQSAAWAGMLVNNLRTQSLGSAMSRTFDGDHPCPLCKAIEAGKKSEKKSEFENKITRIEFPPSHSDCVPLADDHLCAGVEPADDFAESLCGSQLLRPPRVIPS